MEFAASLDIILNEALPAVEKLVKSHKARFIGISGYPLSTLLEVVTKSKVKIDCVLTYARDTLIDNTLHDYIPKFKVMNGMRETISQHFEGNSININRHTFKYIFLDYP